MKQYKNTVQTTQNTVNTSAHYSTYYSRNMQQWINLKKLVLIVTDLIIILAG